MEVENRHIKFGCQEMTDEELMNEFVEAHRTDCFQELYNRYFQELTRFVCWYGGDRTYAEDLVQNIFLKIYERPSLFDSQRNFKVWLYATAKNHSKNELRRSSYLSSTEPPEHSIEQDQSHLDQHVSLRSLIFKAAMKHLNENQKEAFILKYANNLSIEEIGQVCQCNIGTVKSRLFYALKILREKIKHQDLQEL